MLSDLTKFTLTSWLFFLLQLAALIALLVLAVKAYAPIRAFVKRRSFCRRLRKVCREQGYTLTCHALYRSLLFKSTTPELLITTPDVTYAIKFFACLRSKDSYTLTDLNSFYTTNNNKPIFLNMHFPTTGSGMMKGAPKLHAISQSKDSYIKQEKTRPAVTFPEGTEKILCIHPMAVEVNAVRTNHPERIFDGDSFCGCRVYSGSGLLALLR